MCRWIEDREERRVERSCEIMSAACDSQLAGSSARAKFTDRAETARTWSVFTTVVPVERLLEADGVYQCLL